MKSERDAQGDGPISVGDLVQVVRPFCCEKEAVAHGVYGVPWTVESIEIGEWVCPQCRAAAETMFAYSANPYTRKGADRAPVSTLRRIPPLSELESTKRDEPIEEPA